MDCLCHYALEIVVVINMRFLSALNIIETIFMLKQANQLGIPYILEFTKYLHIFDKTGLQLILNSLFSKLALL